MKDKENALWKHIEGEHGGENKGEEIFTMKIEKGFKKALARQISEGVAIEMCEGALLNSKAEWNHARIPRIVIEEGEKQVEDRESGLARNTQSFKEKTKHNRGIENRVRNEKRREVENDTGEKDSSRKKVRLTEKLPTEKKVVEKRRSKETQSRQQEFRRRKTAEKVETDRRKIEKETGERTEERKDDLKKEYWRKVFSKMAEKRENSGLLKIKGVTKHIERIKKGRVKEGGSIVKEVSEKDRGEQSLKLEGNCEITGNIEERNNEIEVELRKEKVEEERKERKEKAMRKVN